MELYCTFIRLQREVRYDNNFCLVVITDFYCIKNMLMDISFSWLFKMEFQRFDYEHSLQRNNLNVRWISWIVNASVKTYLEIL